MIGDAGSTTEDLLDVWRGAERTLLEIPPDDPDRAAVEATVSEAARAYQARIEALKDDLRDG